MLEVDGLVCGYGAAPVLQGVDLRVGDGEIVGVLGRNGMGKTTLVRALLGMTPPLVTGGEIRYRDEVLTGRASHEIARLGIGLVPQGRHVFGSLSVEENLTVIARRRGDGDPWTLERVHDLFPRLAERSRTAARNLSGGEQQMLAIGRALMTNPDLLVMDEASEGLAPPVLATIVERLGRLRESGLAVLLVEQNVGFAKALSDRVMLLGAEGVMAWEGSPAAFDAAPEVTREHLGV